MVVNAGGKKLSSTPFPAIVGQSELKRALLTIAANDTLDGALIVGEKGTAKSTAVRGLADLLPEQRAVADCRYGCAPDDPTLQCASCRKRDSDELPVETRPVPLVTLPLGATRDRIVGTLSVEDALAGEAEFDPGLLARANRGILYVDEVNLLEDHLVDVVLDAAASGVNTVERDGISVAHPANITLIGTMNPEEGDLRPQLRDRFALQATVEGCRDVADRVEIIDRTIERGDDPDQAEAYADAVDRLGETVAGARDRLSRVELPDEFKTEIAELCLEAGVDGHRGDIATARTARTLAALEGRTTVIESDVREAASYALPHRLRSTPFEDEPELKDLLEDWFDEESSDETDGSDEGDGDDEGEPESEDAREDEPDADEGHDRDHDESDEADGSSDCSNGTNDDERDGTERGRRPDEDDRSASTEAGRATAGDREGSDGETEDRTESNDDGTDTESNEDGDDARPLAPGRRAEVGDASAPALETDEVTADRRGRTGGSRTTVTPDTENRGARVRTESASDDGPIDAAASVRSAAARGASDVETEDLRRSVRAGNTSTTIVFAVDASASMRPAMRTAKGVVLELLRDSYQHRDEVAFVAFAGDDADVLLPPTDSVSLAARHLKELPSGDRTPLPAGLETARSVVERSTSEAAVVVLVTDGRANVADGSPTDATREAARKLGSARAKLVVVDAGNDPHAGLSELVVDEAGGERVPLSSLSPALVRSTAESAGAE
ncbi:protporphyrin IX magnesium chelatase [Natronococcus amylolyticus DSM 10524]|uniref:Protporphyrin IX magnesium chelatase n=1 Tax=Natronococcus amylolyticus DSM 10524 TaxID=1227497 RepID=L9X3J7_9EURY|nr:VWA domain-containing protein [Natronococcus amylolyticus]ELY56187.1 protporphyrin IX magnesium chelatase [Natronococcus amylolyticus DSM 10524]